MEKFQELIQQSGLYTTNFIQYFGMQETHWNKETWSKRERSLAHDMVTMLICNMETEDNDIDSMLERLLRQTNLNFDDDAQGTQQVESVQGNESDEEFSEYGDEFDADQYEGDYDNYADEDENLQLERNIPLARDPQYFYRYIILEGSTNAEQIQNGYTTLWKIEQRKKVFDIIDLKEKKFIEVKCTMDIEKRCRDFLSDPVINDAHTALFVINIMTTEHTTINKTDEFRGIEKATKWLIQRKAKMDLMGIVNPILQETDNLMELLFMSPQINEMIEEFSSNYKCDETISNSDVIRPREPLEMNVITPAVLFENLKQDHLDPDSELDPITWDAKILPPFWKEHIQAEEKDLDTIDSFMTIFDNSIVKEGDPEIIEMLEGIRERWDMLGDKQGKHFALFHTNNKKSKDEIPSKLKNMLGIDKKNKKHCETENMKQPENKTLLNKKYATWFDGVVEEMASKSDGLSGKTALKYRIEKEDRVKLHRDAQNAVQHLFEFYGQTNSAVLQSEYTNTFSRLSGAYLAGSRKNGSHSRIVIMPIVNNIYEKGVPSKIKRKKISKKEQKKPQEEFFEDETEHLETTDFSDPDIHIDNLSIDPDEELKETVSISEGEITDTDSDEDPENEKSPQKSDIMDNLSQFSDHENSEPEQDETEIINFYEDEEVLERRFSGLVIRGPHHARSASDKINIITIEFVNSKFKLEYVKKGYLIQLDEHLLLVKSNAIKKIDSPYLTFVRNSLFNPTNLMGEIIINQMSKCNNSNFREISRPIMNDKKCLHFFVDRVVENVLMAVLGNNRDEGYFSMLRKMMMILLSVRRNLKPCSLNIIEFCDSVNECIIDNPLSMYFHNSVLYILAKYVSAD